MDGRVKTLHPAVHGGLLARRDLPEHMAALAEHNIEPIDLVAVNLYPFRETVARKDVTPEEAIENIDIGGPSMLRSAAKNFESVWVVVDPDDYTRVLAALGAQRQRSRPSTPARREGVRAHRRVRRARSPRGSPSSARRSFRRRSSSRSSARNRCATARIPDRPPRSTPSAPASGSPRSSSAAARNCRSTTCSISRARCSPSIRSAARPRARS